MSRVIMKKLFPINFVNDKQEKALRAQCFFSEINPCRIWEIRLRRGPVISEIHA